jgi:hypothetical protein
VKRWFSALAFYILPICVSYRPLNNFRHSLPLGEKVQFEYAWLVLACVNIFFFIPMIFVRLYGEKWRKANWQSPPAFHNDI